MIPLDWVGNTCVEDGLAGGDRRLVIAVLHVDPTQDQLETGRPILGRDRPDERLRERVLPVAHDGRDRAGDYAEHRLGIARFPVVMGGDLPVGRRRRGRRPAMQRGDRIGPVDGAESSFKEAADEGVIALMRPGPA